MAKKPSGDAGSPVDYEIDSVGARARLLDRLASECCGELPARSRTGAARENLFHRLQATPGGLGHLVALRHDLLRGLRDHPAWAAIEADLARVLRGVFDCSALQFARIDATSPAPLLEKLIRYEAVHEIHDWRELRRRLEDDRRCYGFFHPDWPGEPLIFTEVALTRGVSAKVQPLLDPSSPIVDAASCDTAIFYSITNCQPGLRGFAFGNALIMRVLDEVRAAVPRVRTFATLSPIPGFCAWLSAIAARPDGPPGMAAIVARLNAPTWPDRATAADLEADLLPLCAFYLLHVTHAGEPANPVARFHLGNGARLQRVNWLSDLSPAGVSRSAGLTANYVYHSSALERRPRVAGGPRLVNATRELEQLALHAARAWSRRSPNAVLPISA